MLEDERAGEAFILIDALDEYEHTTRTRLSRSKFLPTSRSDITDIDAELGGIGSHLRTDSSEVNVGVYREES